jgi:hypothetical protein
LKRQNPESVVDANLESEKTDNYRWTVEKLKGLFIKQDILPQIILTGRELALMNAIEIVFPHTVNMLCTWHIDKNALDQIYGDYSCM